MAYIVQMFCPGGNYSFDKLPKLFEESNRNVVHSEQLCDDKVLLLCFEEYYFRTDSCSSANIIFTKYDDGIHAKIIAFGGGENILSGALRGTGQNLASALASLLEEYKFQAYPKKPRPKRGLLRTLYDPDDELDKY